MGWERGSDVQRTEGPAWRRRNLGKVLKNAWRFSVLNHFIILCVWVFSLHVCPRVIYTSDAPADQERTLDPL